MSESTAELLRDVSVAGERGGRAQMALIGLASEKKDLEAIVLGVKPLADHADARVRTRAITILAVAMGVSVLPILEAHLRDPDPAVRAAIEDAAEDVGEPGRGLLKRLVADSDFGVRFWAAVTLSELGDGDGLKVLVEGLAAPNTRFESLQGLFRLRDRSAEVPVRHLLTKWFLPAIDRVAALGVLARLGDAPARKTLQDEIERRKSDVRGLAIEIAGDLPLDDAVPTLERILADKKDPMRGAAAVALGRMGVRRVSTELARLLADEAEDADLRASAAEGLGALGTAEAREALQKAAESVKDAEVKDAVNEALGE
jgi:HEAT repeat protein